MINGILYIALGIIAGGLSGLLGIGGGVIIVPALVLLFRFSQHMAQGTSTAMLLPPIGILAAWTYYKNGMVDVKAAALLCAGFVLGGLFGAELAVTLPKEVLRRSFGVILFGISLKLILSK